MQPLVLLHLASIIKTSHSDHPVSPQVHMVGLLCLSLLHAEDSTGCKGNARYINITHAVLFSLCNCQPHLTGAPCQFQPLHGQ